MLRTFVVEDNAAALDNVLDFLREKCPQVEVVGTSGEVDDAYEGIYRTRPDLLISDIQLIGGLCYDLLNRLNDAGRLEELRIIFMTLVPSFENAKNGYQYSPIAFLEKPFTAAELQAAIEKIAQPAAIPAARQQMEQLLTYWGSQLNASPRLTVNLPRGGLQLVELSDIRYLQSEETITKFYLLGGDPKLPLVSNKNIGHYATLLNDNETFIPISKSVIINLDQLARYDHRESLVHFKDNGGHVAASREGGRKLRKYLLQNPLPGAAPTDSLVSFFKKIFGQKE